MDAPHRRAPRASRPPSVVLGAPRLRAPRGAPNPRPLRVTVAACLVGAGVAAAACSASPEPVRTPAPRASATSVATAAAVAEQPRALSPNRRPLAPPSEEALAVELLAMAGGARVLAVAEDGERAAWARTIDDTGALGKPRRFEGEHVVTAFDASDGRTTFVTSNGDALCVATFGRDADTAEARACHDVRPEVVVPMGDRLALLLLDVSETKAKIAKVKAAATTATPASKKAPAKKAGAKTSATKSSSAADAASSAKTAAPKTTSTKKPGAKKAPAKKKPAKKRATAEHAKVTIAQAKVGVRVAWVARDGALDPASVASGLTFERPLPGMMLADAAPRAGFADLLFYETVPKPKKPSKTPYGSARLGVASLGADGLLVAGSRAQLTEGDLEYGYISGQNGPRLLSNERGTALVTFAGRGGTCRAERVFPALGPLVPAKAACLVDPLGWALGGGSAPPAPTAPERLLAADPRRAPGQTKADAPLVAWAGERAVFWAGRGLGSAARSDGTPSDAAAPFVAKRARIAWSAFAPDGEGIAAANGKLYRIDTAGTVTEVADPNAASSAGAAPATASSTDAAWATRAHERRRAARIGDAWWLADGDVVRLLPKPLEVDALAGRAHPDATALVGGRERGALLEVASGALRTTFIAADGAITAGPVVTSPVRAGFAAVERAAGGAIVAGVSAADPTRVIAFALDATGKLGTPHPTSLAVSAGTFAVRLAALPGGGALLFDHDRKRVAWLDDDANERASAALPNERAPASCVDGRDAEVTVPSPEPGKLVRIADLATPGTCLTGDVAWTSSGGLRWFGATARDLDSIAEAGVLDAATIDAGTGTVRDAPSSSPTPSSPPAATPTSTTPPPTAPAAPACAADMVSIAGRFCIDRFESTLVDAKTQRTLSPDYPPTPNLLEIVLGDWATERTRWGDVHARAFPLPEVPSWQRGLKTEPVASPRFGARPNGYVTGLVAEAACAAAGKRLCTLDEHTTACRGEAETDFPYGPDYQDGVCNVFREDHPAALLHHNASLGHLDPRLNRVRAKGRPLFETAGARPACRSVWGSDAVYDLVGNLDEWVDEGGGAFAGGFYSRSTRAGCDAVITAHPKAYADYSTGVRCCKDAGP